MPHEPKSRTAQHVLIVDDDPASVKLLNVLLQAEGFETRTAANAEEALQVLALFHPSLIVLDLVLPLMSGFLLAQQLKADPRTRDIVLIAVSGFNGENIERAALSAGCAALARKPINPSDFVQLLRDHLGANT